MTAEWIDGDKRDQNCKHGGSQNGCLDAHHSSSHQLRRTICRVVTSDQTKSSLLSKAKAGHPVRSRAARRATVSIIAAAARISWICLQTATES